MHLFRRFNAMSFEARAASLVAVGIAAAVWFVIVVVMPSEREQLRLERERFEEDVAVGRKLRTGEPVITDDKTGCKYIKTIFSIGSRGEFGYTLTPRSDEDGRHMGCGRK